MINFEFIFDTLIHCLTYSVTRVVKTRGCFKNEQLIQIFIKDL